MSQILNICERLIYHQIQPSYVQSNNLGPKQFSNAKLVFVCQLKSFIFFLILNSYLKFFNWNIVDLQCCVSFRCTIKWISYSHTYICSFLDSFPCNDSILSRCAIQSVLTSHLFYITVCICQSQSPDLSHPPLPRGNHKFLFYICDSISVL